MRPKVQHLAIFEFGIHEFVTNCDLKNILNFTNFNQ